MARKKFEEAEYDPFEQDRLRTLSRQVATHKDQGSSGEISPSEKIAPNESPPAITNVVAIPKKPVREYASLEAFQIAKGPQKSRTFKCSSVAQDKELDGFLARLKEVTATDVPFQVIARAAIAATMRAEEQIAEVIRKKPAMKRPANVLAAEYAQFEQYWADVVMEALRKVRPYQ
jgi:hypothetical protein